MGRSRAGLRGGNCAGEDEGNDESADDVFHENGLFGKIFCTKLLINKEIIEVMLLN